MNFKRHIALLCLLSEVLRVLAACGNCLNGACSNGKCQYGCENNWSGTRCTDVLPCDDTCKLKTCTLDETGTIVCVFGCVDGYCGKKCRRNCKQDCTKCSKTCECNENMKEDRNNTARQNTNGECGMNCKYCLHDGHCKSCRPKYFGDKCQFQCKQCVDNKVLEVFTTVTDCTVCSYDESSEQRKMLIAITVIGAITLGLVFALLCHKKGKKLFKPCGEYLTHCSPQGDQQNQRDSHVTDEENERGGERQRNGQEEIDEERHGGEDSQNSHKQTDKERQTEREEPETHEVNKVVSSAVDSSRQMVMKQKDVCTKDEQTSSESTPFLPGTQHDNPCSSVSVHTD